MKPWCAEGDLPTAANLNLYRGWNSCVGWHSDDEPLFGKCVHAKLIVSVSRGSFALFRWRRQSCSSNEGSCRLDHGDILVMDGQCQDEFLHRTSPGRDQERINITFRWVKQHVSSCPLFKAGVACCLPTCAKGLSVSDEGNVSFGIFWVLWFLLGVLCTWGVLALLVSLLCTRLGLLRCASRWTRPLGGGRWRHYLCNFPGEYYKIHKIACMNYWVLCGIMMRKPYMLALVGQPSLRGYHACMVYWDNGAFRRNCRQKQCKTFFSPFLVFLFSRNPVRRFWGLIFWHFWAGRARHPGPPSQPQYVSLEFDNVGGWLTHGDLALSAGVDFLAVAEHRLIPARVRSEWSRLRSKGISSVWWRSPCLAYFCYCSV